MSNYTKTTNFGAKDTLPSGDSQKIIRGTEFDTEFNNIATAVATKLEVDGSNNLAISGTFSSTKLIPTGGTATGNGMYLPAANAVAISTNGTERLRIDSSGVASFASNPILNGGTANGLVYLDGSKVATSGSAVTFDGTNLATTGTASATKLIPTGGTATGNGLYLPDANTVALSTNGVERVRVDSSGNLGVGTTVGAASGTGLIIYSPTSTRLQLRNSTTGDTTGDGCGLLAFGSDLYVENRENGATLFFNNGSERARIDSSGNLGVGTASPNTYGKLAVVGDGGTINLIAATNTTTTSVQHRLFNSSGTSVFRVIYYGASYASGSFFNIGANGTVLAQEANAPLGIGTIGVEQPLIFGTNSVERARIDSSGNFGLGTSSPLTKLHISGSTTQTITVTCTGGSGVNLDLTATSTEAKIGTPNGVALLFSTSNIERARIDASGNFGIGTSSPSARLDIRGLANFFSGASGTFNYINIGRTGSEARIGVAAATNDFLTGITAGDSVFYSVSTGNSWYGTASSGAAIFTTNNTERARITSGGQLCLGVTAANGSARFTVGGLTTGTSAADVFVGRTGTETDGVGLGASIQLQNNTNTTACIIQQYSNNLQFFNYTGAAWTERARITSGGSLYVGTTTSLGATDYRLQVTNDTSCALFRTTNSAAWPVSSWNSATTGDNLLIGLFTESGAGVQRGSIDYNRTGGLTRYNTTSDYRAKDIIGPLANTGATIDALKVYEGKMKDATQSRPMLIAHEAQEYAPYAVSGVKDEVNEDGTPKFQQMDVSSLVPLLLAELQSLRARVATLENN